MSEYSDAKLIILPNEGVKAGTMFVVKPTDGSGDGVMDRAGEKTRTNKEGNVENVPANLLLPDYSNGGCGVIKPEPQATQLYELTDVMSTQTKTTTANDYVVSFYGTGTITFSGTHTGVLVGTGVNDRVEVTFLASVGSLTSTVSGSVTKGQLQLGTVADSYIPNTGVGTVTRIADQLTDFGDVNTFNSEEGVLFVEMAALSDTTLERYIQITDGTNDNRVICRLGGAIGTIKLLSFSGGVVQGNITYSVPSVIDFNKVAIVYNNDKYELWVNGSKRGENLSKIMPIGLNTMNFSISNTKFYGKVKRVQVYKTALSDAKLEALTTL